jgi:hypothetical protein
VTEVDLATGAKQTFTVDGQSNSFTYSRPTGQTLLRLNANSDGRYTSTLEGIDLSGTKQLTFPTDQLGAAGKFNNAYPADARRQPAGPGRRGGLGGGGQQRSGRSTAADARAAQRLQTGPVVDLDGAPCCLRQPSGTSRHTAHRRA